MIKPDPIPTNRAVGKRIMVVDDDNDFRMLLCDRLQRLGLECVEAENGEDARLLLQKIPVDVVITDYWMPKMDGMALIQWLQHHNDSVPIIFISGDLSKITREQAERANVYAIMEKPCSLSEISLKIEEIFH